MVRDLTSKIRAGLLVVPSIPMASKATKINAPATTLSPIFR
jgi:hypothetical protein